jgi:hypothetical protein
MRLKLQIVFFCDDFFIYIFTLAARLLVSPFRTPILRQLTEYVCESLPLITEVPISRNAILLDSEKGTGTHMTRWYNFLLFTVKTSA